MMGTYDPAIRKPDDLREAALKLASAFLTTRKRAGAVRRARLYAAGDHHKLRELLARDWRRERDRTLRVNDRLWLDINPQRRLPRVCGEHLRHSVRTDTVLDHFLRHTDADPRAFDAWEVRLLGEITATAPWILWLTTLCLHGRRMGWLRGKQIHSIVWGCRKLPKELRWSAGHYFDSGQTATVGSLCLLRVLRVPPELVAQKHMRALHQALAHGIRGSLEAQDRRAALEIVSALSANPGSRVTS